MKEIVIDTGHTVAIQVWRDSVDGVNIRQYDNIVSVAAADLPALIAALQTLVKE